MLPDGGREIRLDFDELYLGHRMKVADIRLALALCSISCYNNEGGTVVECNFQDSSKFSKRHFSERITLRSEKCPK